MLQVTTPRRGVRLLLPALTGLGLALAPAAHAAPTCTTAGSTATCVFSTVGTDTWTAPQGVTSATFDVFGAQGASGAAHFGEPGPGGQGGEATATLAVSPGTSYRLTVGGAGGTGSLGAAAGGSGGFNGGGTGGAGVDV